MSEINNIEELPEGIFPINLKTIDQYQQKYPSLKAKYEMGTHQQCSFRGVSNIHLNLIMCKDKVVIRPILESYVLHWYHTYILHTVVDRTEVVVLQHLYWPVIIEYVRKEGSNCDTCQRTKLSNKKYGKITS